MAMPLACQDMSRKSQYAANDAVIMVQMRTITASAANAHLLSRFNCEP